MWKHNWLSWYIRCFVMVSWSSFLSDLSYRLYSILVLVLCDNVVLNHHPKMMFPPGFIQQRQYYWERLDGLIWYISHTHIILKKVWNDDILRLISCCKRSIVLAVLLTRLYKVYGYETKVEFTSYYTSTTRFIRLQSLRCLPRYLMRYSPLSLNVTVLFTGHP